MCFIRSYIRSPYLTFVKPSNGAFANPTKQLFTLSPKRLILRLVVRSPSCFEPQRNSSNNEHDARTGGLNSKAEIGTIVKIHFTCRSAGPPAAVRARAQKYQGRRFRGMRVISASPGKMRARVGKINETGREWAEEALAGPQKERDSTRQKYKCYAAPGTEQRLHAE